jgi:predicted PurR-regulated permease PerM
MLSTSRYTHLVVIGLGLVGLFLFLKWFLDSALNVLLLVFAGILFAVFVRGLSRFVFGRFKKLPEKVGIAVTLIFLVAISITFIIFLAPQLVEQVTKLTEELPKAISALREKTNFFNWLEDLVESGDGQSAPFNDKLTSKVMGLFAPTFGAITGFFIILFVGIYLSFTPFYYVGGLLGLLPSAWRPRADQVMQALDHTLSHWLIGRFVGMLVVSVSSYAGLLLLDIPLPLSLAVLAGLLTFVPNIGPILSALPPVLLGYMQSPSAALYVFVLYLAIQSVESYLITPLIQKREVSLPPVLTLTSQLFFGSLFGFLGLLLATPLTACGLVLVKMLYVEDVLGDSTDIQSPGGSSN